MHRIICCLSCPFSGMHFCTHWRIAYPSAQHSLSAGWRNAIVVPSGDYVHRGRSYKQVPNVRQLISSLCEHENKAKSSDFYDVSALENSFQSLAITFSKVVKTKNKLEYWENVFVLGRTFFGGHFLENNRWLLLEVVGGWVTNFFV